MRQLTEDEAIAEIKANPQAYSDVLQRDRSGKGYICPVCGSGGGKDGTGMRVIPNARDWLCHCFACNATMDIISMYQTTRNMTFTEAVNEMAARLGIEVQWSHGGRSETMQGDRERNTTMDAYDGHPQQAETQQATQQPETDHTLTGGMTPGTPGAAEPQPDYSEYIRHANDVLMNDAAGQPGRDYLAQRGIGMDYIGIAWLGYDPQWISPTVIRNQRAKGSSWTPPGKPCLIIPTSPHHYVARDIRPDAEMGEAEKKFKKMNEGSPEIYGEDLLYNETDTPVFVVEGALDALSVDIAGGMATALHSTSNVKLFLERLRQRPTRNTLILALDADKAGRDATQELRDGLTRLNIPYITFDITGGAKDANEALVNDSEHLSLLVQQAMGATATRPDSVARYMAELMAGEIDTFKRQDIRTGFPNLDAEAGMMYPGLYILAAATSLGKTTLALQLGDQIAAAGHDVVFFSLEMSRLELVSKSISRMTAQADLDTAVEALSIRRGNLNRQVIDAMHAYQRMIGDKMSIVQCDFMADMGYIEEYLRRYKQQNGVTPVAIIDYLQVVQPTERGTGKREEVDAALIQLKRLSRELETPILAISSLNRTNYNLPFSFESLKESGMVEYTADVIWGLQLTCLQDMDDKTGVTERREAVKKAKEEKPRRIELVCVKNRYGKSNFSVWFDYYPALDWFVPGREPPARVKKSGKK